MEGVREEGAESWKMRDQRDQDGNIDVELTNSETES